MNDWLVPNRMTSCDNALVDPFISVVNHPDEAIAEFARLAVEWVWDAVSVLARMTGRDLPFRDPPLGEAR
jgi:hypothetical protein